VNLLEVPFNMGALRVTLSPAQYYIDKDQRKKADARTANGLWSGISPYNLRAAWMWNGALFITVQHGDIRTNEWIAWAVLPTQHLVRSMEKAVIAKSATATVYAAITDADEAAHAEAAFLKQAAAVIDASFKAIDVCDSRSQPCAPPS
jgi:hypothetical protein